MMQRGLAAWVGRWRAGPMIAATTAGAAVAVMLTMGFSGPDAEPSSHPICAPSAGESSTTHKEGEQRRFPHVCEDKEQVIGLFRCPASVSVRSAVEVASLDDDRRALVLEAALDVWSESTLADPLVVVVDDHGRAALQTAGITTRIVDPDIDASAAAERARLQSAHAQRPGDFFSEYRRFEAVDAYLDRLDAVRPALTRIEPLGTSLEGRPIRALRISTAPADAPAYVINGGQHAREWISVATTTCIADRLVHGHGSDPEITTLLDEMQVFVVPVVNPDGYEYSWTDDRYWRKNRRDEHGVDLNRNFPVAFGRKGSSDQPASPIYRGTHPFSEPEAQAMRDLLRRVPVELHIDYHSFSQLVLHPWSHTAEPASDRGRLAALADAMASAIYATHGKRYKVIDGARLYPASGTLMDWVYGEREAASFVVELRPARGDGFILPPEQIVPTCEESLAATLALARRRTHGLERDSAGILDGGEER